MSIHIDNHNFDIAHFAFQQHMRNKSNGEPFINFTHTFLVDDEISYKWTVYKNAKSALKLNNWHQWRKSPGNIIQAVKDACQPSISRNLLVHRYGFTNSSEGALYKVSAKEEIDGLENQLYQLFLGDEIDKYDFGERFDALADYLRKIRLGCNWAFLSYLSFIYRPQLYFPVRPSFFDALLNFYGIDQKISGFVSWDRYSVLLELARTLKEKLLIYGIPNAIEIQSYMWVVAYLIIKNKLPVKVQEILEYDFKFELDSRMKQADERERIGLLGEKYIFEQERERLITAGRQDLADRVRMVSFETNSTYDILSFNQNRTERHIEVKTTSRTRENDDGFWLSENERLFAKSDNNWVVYRVWDIDTLPGYDNLGNIVQNNLPEWDIQPSGWYVKKTVNIDLP